MATINQHTCSPNFCFSSSWTPASGHSAYTCLCPSFPLLISYKIKRDNAAFALSLSRSQLAWVKTSNAGPTSDSIAADPADSADLLFSCDPPRGKRKADCRWKVGRNLRLGDAENPLAKTTLFLFLLLLLVGDSSNNKGKSWAAYDKFTIFNPWELG